MDDIQKGIQLKRIKKNIENSYQGFKGNYERYTRFRNFIFVTTMGDSGKDVNNELLRNSLEFNILEAYLSRLIGEFAKHEPSIEIHTSDDYMPGDMQQKKLQAEQIRVLEGFMRYTLQESNKRGMEKEVYRDSLSGGYSSVKIFTDYVDSKSFLQHIKMQRTYDQTLVGFDSLAAAPDKSDGDYCFEIVPMRKEDFEREFPEVDISKYKFQDKFITSSSGMGSFGPFNWSFKVGQDHIIMVADYYEKVKKKVKLHRLSNDENMTDKEYKNFVKAWEEAGILAQVPMIVDTRETEITTIKRFQMVRNDILNEEDTDYPCLPIKFFDGNSVVSKDDTTGSSYQMTKPIFYNAEGAQRMKNFAGQVLVNEIENMRPAQIIASLESIPPQYLDLYRKPQNTTTLIYNAFHNGNPNVPLQPPIIAPRQGLPQDVMEAFMAADTVIQNALGNFDTSMTQLTSAEMSGKAVQEITTLSNASAMPYMNNYLLGLESCAQMVIDMMPMYYKTPRSIPVISQEGKRSYEMINQPGGVMIDFEPGAFKIKISAGVSFGLQQSRALQQVIALSNAIPSLGQFINDACGDLVLDNVEMRNVETMKVRWEEYSQQQAEMKQKAMEMQSQQPKIDQQMVQIAAQQVQSENQVGMAKVQQAARSEEMKSAAKMAELEMDNKKLQVEIAKILAELSIAETKVGIEQQKADDERINKVIDAAIKESEHKHGLAGKQADRALAALAADREHERAESEADRAMEKIVKGEK
jgi:hypothetical protein